ncbi:hypothetical protein [Chryseobacterium sp. JUb7]|uniref:hypothetical protein n=1 Tax=Chryseobacterium sp. JUb7 TaxID=2940599 RepID=UPI0021673279|nr:hypothetical protein [Chryseobacterium sp. JUb7]MCS3529222.1 hypothetical protein [Chryseobacterium sp. JUb7]
MKFKLLLSFIVSFLSLSAFSQKSKEKEMAVYAEKRGSDYYLVRLPKGKDIPNVYVYSNGETKPYKKYTQLLDVAKEFPKMMETANSAKEELVSVLNKDGHFYEITTQRKDPKNFEKTTITVYEVFNGQKRIVEEYGSIMELMPTPYKEAIFIN